MPRLRRAIQAFTGSLGLSVTGAVLALATTPLVVQWLGDSQFGAFRASLDWYGYLGMLEFGIGGALAPLFAKAVASDDRQHVVSVIRSGWLAYVRVTAWMLLAGAVLTIALPWLIKAPPDWRWSLWLGGAVMTLAVLLTPLTVFRPYLEASQRGGLLSLLLILQLLAYSGLGVAAAGLGFGLAGQMIAYTVGVSLLPLSLGLIGLRQFPEIWQTSATVDTASVWALSWPTFLFNLCSRLSMLTDNILLAAILGPAAVAPFFLTQRVLALATSQAQAIAGSTWAGLIDFYYRGRLDLFERRFLQLTRFATVGGAALLVPIAVWNEQLISAWVGASRYAGDTVTWLCAVNGVMLSAFSVLGWPFIAAGQVRVVLPVAIVIALVNVTVSATVTYQGVLAGPLWGTFVAFVLVNWPMVIIQLHQHFQIKPRRIILAFIEPFLAGVAYALLWLLIKDRLPQAEAESGRIVRIMVTMIWVSLGFVGFLPLAWYVALPRDDRLEWSQRLRGIINRG